MKLILMGTPDFAVPAFKELINSEHEILCVFTQPPRPAGRGMDLKKSPVQMLAEENNIDVFTPEKLLSDNVDLEIFNECDAAIVIAYGLIIPEFLLGKPSHGFLNVHPSDLPRWRGAAPIQRTVLAGDKSTALCIMKMDAGLDTGDVLSREQIDLPVDMTSGKLHDLMAEKSGAALLGVLENIENITPKSQQGEATYAKKISKKEALIDFSKTAAEIDCLIRGMHPYPLAKFEKDGKVYKIHEAEIAEKIGDNEFRLKCADGYIKPIIIQKQGGKPMKIGEFLRGNKL